MGPTSANQLFLGKLALDVFVILFKLFDVFFQLLKFPSGYELFIGHKNSSF